MALPAGTRFGPFEILSLLGAGGMGEVYRARDARLNRDVALKVLPEALSADPERSARFTREAQVLASLSHSNIGGIHGLEEANGRQALVLELVDGPTLADRIAQGAMPLEEALPIARQIAEALEAAHEQGIVHRDLKPANIKLRPDGMVKVLDFGLAKALSRTDGEASGARPDVTASPTMISPATMTSAGLILGTAAYMAPEQARGKGVDRRADIWAFGCVLYEMLTGRRTFEGDEVTDTLAGILRGEPAWDAIPASTPRAIQRLLRRCLEKEPRARLQAIGDARIEIAEAISAPPDVATPVPAAVPSRTGRAALPIVATIATALAVGGGMWALRPDASNIQMGVTRSLIEMNAFDHRPPARPGESRGPIRADRTALALSPDGRTLVFRGIAVDVNPGGGTQSVLFVRPLDSLIATPIATTTGSETPFFSPDGAWIGYWDAGELRRVPAAGSTASTTIARVPGEGQTRIMGASWGDGDVIVFSAGGDLWKVAASGGTPERILEKQEDEYGLRLPHVLPGGETMLFTRARTVFRWDDAQVVVRSLKTGQQNVLLEDAADARYVSTGHLVFMRRGKLMAIPFDLQSLTVSGGAVAIIDDVQQAVNMGNGGADSGAGQVAISSAGTLVYATGGTQPDDPREFVWVSRDGTAEPIPAPRQVYTGGHLSRDGQKIVTFTNDRRVWVYDLSRGTLTPLTPQQEAAGWGTFSPDGTRVAFQLRPAGRSSPMAIRAADGTGSSEQLNPAAGGVQSPGSWSIDDKIAYVQRDEKTGFDIWVFDVRMKKASPLIQTEAAEAYPAFSPDGKWLAYVSGLSGSNEVYVQPYPGPGPRIQVSNSGGTAPAWAGNSELFYRGPSTNGFQMMSVKVTTTSTGLSAGVPHELFTRPYGSTTPVRGWDVTADGRRFLLIRGVDPPPQPPTQLVLVQNFGEELKRRVSTGTQK